MKLHDIRDLNAFLDFLRNQHVYFTLSKLRPEALMVTIHTLANRIEIDFFDDHIEYSVFSGDKSVRDDVQWIFEEIRSSREG